MQPLNCVIIEDEPLAAEVLQDYIKQVPHLNLRAVCPDALFAMEVLQNETIDLIFLDIHLPKIKGFDFIKTLTRKPSIIITSAYHEYALQSYEYDVVDYLLKPIEFSRFLIAVNKVNNEKVLHQSLYGSTQRPYLFFNVSKKRIKIYVDEILYIESIKEYIKIHTKSKAILTKFPIGEIEGQLVGKDFLRIHRSFIVAKEKIDAVTATDIEISGQTLPIGRSYKDAVQAIIDRSEV